MSLLCHRFHGSCGGHEAFSQTVSIRHLLSAVAVARVWAEQESRAELLFHCLLHDRSVTVVGVSPRASLKGSEGARKTAKPAKMRKTTGKRGFFAIVS